MLLAGCLQLKDEASIAGTVSKRSIENVALSSGPVQKGDRKSGIAIYT
jgi:hypothetical protein